MKRACMSDLEPSYACVNFFRLSKASVDGKQHFSEVVFNALVGLSLLEKYQTSGGKKDITGALEN